MLVSHCVFVQKTEYMKDKVTGEELRAFCCLYRLRYGKYESKNRFVNALMGQFYDRPDDPTELLRQCEALGLIHDNSGNIKIRKQH